MGSEVKNTGVKTAHIQGDGRYPKTATIKSSQTSTRTLIFKNLRRSHFVSFQGRHPATLVGATQVGCLQLRQKLMEMEKEKFAGAVPHTSRPRKPDEQDGVHYHFVSRQQFQEGARKFVEWGEYQKHFYGTSFDAIRPVIERGKTCVLTLKPQALPIQSDPETAKDVHMFLARGQRWKRLRMISNPTFSASKLKAMAPTATELIDLLVSLLREKANTEKSFDIYSMYQALTLDIIGRCAFGIHTDCQRNPDDEFLVLCKQVFYDTMKLNWVQLCGILFPEAPHLWLKVMRLRDLVQGGNPFVTLGKKLADLVNHRRTISESNSIDLLQLLLDSEIGDNEEFAIENEQMRAWKSDSDQPKMDKKLLPEEVVSTCMLFLLAGYETTSVALAYTTYFLACNPDVQQKVQNEIDEFSELAPYEAMNKCIFLDYVISETLRLYPIATPIQARKCMESCMIGDITIPKGLTVAADVWSVHYDPQIWGPDADKFRPERFTPEESQGRHPMAWLPFGAGPRNCIGMRFALMEAKLTLLNVLKRFTLHTCPETEVIKFHYSNSTDTDRLHLDTSENSRGRHHDANEWHYSRYRRTHSMNSADTYGI